MVQLFKDEILILEAGLFCWVHFQVRKDHSAFNKVRIVMAKVIQYLRKKLQVKSVLSR